MAGPGRHGLSQPERRVIMAGVKRRDKLTSGSEPVGSLDIALNHAARLLASQPALAAEQAAEILKVVPGHPVATLVLGAARRAGGDPAAALEILRIPLFAAQPLLRRPRVTNYGDGTRGRGERASAAITELRRAVLALRPDYAEAWVARAGPLTAVGEERGADDAFARYRRSSTKDVRLIKAATALGENRIPEAEALLREHLKERPNDIAAMRMLAEVVARLGRHSDAEKLLVRCLELASWVLPPRGAISALVLHRQYKDVVALAVSGTPARQGSARPGLPQSKGSDPRWVGTLRRVELRIYDSVFSRTICTMTRCGSTTDTHRRPPGDRTRAIAAPIGAASHSSRYNGHCVLEPRQSEDIPVHRGGRRGDARRSSPRNGGSRARIDCSCEFALGKALEDDESWAESFAHYAAGNEIRRKRLRTLRRGSATMRMFVQRSNARCSRASSLPHGAAMAPTPPTPSSSSGCRAPARRCWSKSWRATRWLRARWSCPTSPLSPANSSGVMRARGEKRRVSGQRVAGGPVERRGLPQRSAKSYLESTRVCSAGPRAPFFIDKMPNNWFYVGLIQPHSAGTPRSSTRAGTRSVARVSVFKQHFARGQEFTYDLEGILASRTTAITSS